MLLWVALALLAALANAGPVLIYRIGGDSLFHLELLQCFGQQFWQGNLRPHWCITADAGLGSPTFLFYFPLPYYAASLFYPLTWLGADTYDVYALSCLTVTVLTVGTAYIWLRPIAGPKKALLCATLYLSEPGRFERLLAAAASEPPRVRAMLGAIGQQTGQPGSKLARLRESGLRLSRFDFGILATLANAREWQAKERRSHATVSTPGL
jgi:hypothetical protein